MSNESLIPAAIGVAWTLACLAVLAAACIRWQRAGGLRPEQGFFIGGMLNLAIAPYIIGIYGVRQAPTEWNDGVVLLIGPALLGAWIVARRRAQSGSASSSLSFRQKSAAFIAATLLIVFGSYFARTWGTTLEQAAPVFIRSVLLVIVLAIVGHIVIALFHAPLNELEQPSDERDREVRLPSFRNAYYVLALGMWAVLVLAVLAFEPIVVANTALASIVLSELVYYASSVAYYRYSSR